MSSEEQTDTTMVAALVDSPSEEDKRKKLGVHWKDDLDAGEHDRIDTCSIEGVTSTEQREVCNKKPSSSTLLTNGEKHQQEKTKPARRTRLSRQELQQLMRKQQAAIRHACALELQLLNKSAEVRQKRMRMVHRLQRMQRKLKSSTADNAKKHVCTCRCGGDDDFVLPPVYQSSSHSASTSFKKKRKPKVACEVVDMTSSSDESSATMASPAEE